VTRRVAVLALPQLIAQSAQQWDQWHALEAVWNPFAEKLNRGVLDVQLWHKVVVAIVKIDGRECKAK